MYPKLGLYKSIKFTNYNIESKEDLIEQITHLKKQRNAIILAHFYQVGEIQDIADFVGDSLALAKQAEKTNADVILLSGVYFMAEIAKIINPEKIVLIPDEKAGCYLADSINALSLKEFLLDYPNHIVVSYINTSAEIKAMSDYICTSSNAVSVINEIPLNARIVFVPDRNLGKYLINITGRDMVLWNGECKVHSDISESKLKLMRNNLTNSKLIAHPECTESILKNADFIGSTSALLQYVLESDYDNFVVATEVGVIHQMKKMMPHKTILPAPINEINKCACSECEYMKMNSLAKIKDALETLKPEVLVDENVSKKAKCAVDRMLNIA